MCIPKEFNKSMRKKNGQTLPYDDESASELFQHDAKGLNSKPTLGLI